VTGVLERPATRPVPVSAPESPRPRRFRADIQGLRAVAIGVVVLYHLWPNRLPGGYVGVDVFFVISGYLITGHLLTAVGRERPLAMLAGFYARRIRRLAPAAITVLGAVLLATGLLLPATTWSDTAGHVLASTLFVENWHLAAQSVSYLDTTQTHSALQHFWSLSVEEQFYIVWPCLLLVATRLLRRRPTAVAIAVAAVGLASLAWGIVETASTPDVAFFDTVGRTWEFCLGALLATVGSPLGRRAGLVLPWLGLAAIGVASFVFNGSSPFPGTDALLPTLGAAAVLAGRDDSRFSVASLSRFRPIRGAGDISYSTYLWHWPLIILLPPILGVSLSTGLKLVVLVVTIALAAATYRWIETPGRRSAWLSRTRLRSFVAGGVALGLVASACLAVSQVADAQTRANDAQLAASALGGDPCFAARAVDTSTCGDPWGRIDLKTLPAPLADKPVAWKDDCIDDITRNTEKVCTLGDTHAARTVLLWGDSHAGAWSSAFDAAGRIDHVRVLVAARNKCPSSLAAPVSTAFGDHLPTDQQHWCDARNHWVLNTLVPHADQVVLADLWANYVFSGSDQVRGYRTLIDAVRSRGVPISVMQHVPLTGSTLEAKVWGPKCLAEGNHHCWNDEAHALSPQTSKPFRLLQADGYGSKVGYIATSSRFCHDGRCYFAIGGVSVYFDGSHLSNTYSTSLGPWLAQRLHDTVMLSDFRG
jgi:peptidoglycan/LPS O-acetylase OafA/YrhL